MEGNSLQIYKQGNRVTQVSLQNFTIDDELGDPTNDNHFAFSPSTVWIQGSGCKTCAAKLDPAQTQNGTWHDSSFYPVGDPHAPPTGTTPTAEVQFTGKFLLLRCLINVIFSHFMARLCRFCLLHPHPTFRYSGRRYRYDFLHRQRASWNIYPNN